MTLDASASTDVDGDSLTYQWSLTSVPAFRSDYNRNLPSLQCYSYFFRQFTGTVAGEYPKSWVKVTLLVLAVVIVLIIALSLGSHR